MGNKFPAQSDVHGIFRPEAPIQGTDRVYLPPTLHANTKASRF